MVLRNHPPTHNPLLPDPPSYCPARSPLLHPSDSESRSLPPSPYPLRIPIQPSPTVSPPTEILNPSLPYHLPTHPDTISHPPHHHLPTPRFKISSSPTVSSSTQSSNLTLPYHLLTNPVFVSRAPADIAQNFYYILPRPTTLHTTLHSCQSQISRQSPECKSGTVSLCSSTSSSSTALLLHQCSISYSRSVPY